MNHQAFILIAAFAAAGVTALYLTRVNNRESWRATVTPLASIIGSGFLVAAPLLVGTFGGGAILAMAVLLVAVYAVGHVVRFNIRYGEPLFSSDRRDRQLVLFEGLSDAALAFAYFISVAYYLALLGAFALKGFGIEGAFDPRWVTTVLLVLIGTLGLTGGLRAVVRVETVAVGLKLAVIAGLCAALAVGLFTADRGLLTWPAAIPVDGAKVSVLLGLLIVCQGFETSRYLGSEFDAALRVKTMRWAQFIAGGIYLGFFALITPFIPVFAAGDGVTALVDVADKLAIGMAAIVTIGAAASQFTAAVADSLASTGLLSEVSRGRLRPEHGYVLLIPVALAVVWLTDVTQLISYASRAFAIYYALQCATAVRVAIITPDNVGNRNLRIAAYAGVGALAVAVVLLGQPASE
jgi:hypothetical protein